LPEAIGSAADTPDAIQVDDVFSNRSGPFHELTRLRREKGALYLPTSA
jgi:hypothetical protein